MACLDGLLLCVTAQFWPCPTYLTPMWTAASCTPSVRTTKIVIFTIDAVIKCNSVPYQFTLKDFTYVYRVGVP